MPWLYLLLAGLAEIFWASALKKSDGWKDPAWSAAAVAGMLVSFWLLARAMQHLPASTAYGVWVGIGAAGVAVVGMALLGEPVSPARVGFLSLIIIGTVGLRLAA